MRVSSYLPISNLRRPAFDYWIVQQWSAQELMMKCDMCYDRTSIGKKPMCATVCPSQALFFGTRAEVERLRPRSTPINQFQFGRQRIVTKVNSMVPKQDGPKHVDVTSVLEGGKQARPDVMLSAIHMPATVEEGR